MGAVSDLVLRGPLAALGPEEVPELLQLGARRSYTAGDVLVRQAMIGDHVYLLLQGRVRVVRSTRDGSEILVALRGPGDTIGELAVLDSGPRVATVSAIEDVIALALQGSDFTRFLAERPHLMLAMLRLLTQRLRESDQRLVEARATDTLTRLARHLLELGARFGVPSDDGLDLDIPLSQEQLASWIGASREAISIGLRTLRERQAVATGRMRITLLDVEILREAALG